MDARATPVPSPRQLRNVLLAGLLAMNLFVCALAGYTLLQSRQQHELRAGIWTQNVAQAIDQSLSNSIDKIDLALRAVGDELETQLAAGSLDAAAVDAVLARYEARLPEVEAIRVADAAGAVIFGRGLASSEHPSWADRDYFIHLREHADAGLRISPPRMGRVAKQPIVSFARRYNHPDGRFAGVISAAIALDQFSALLARFQLGPHGTAVLRDAGLGLIARHPPLPGTPAGTAGDRTVSDELRRLVDAGVASADYHPQAPEDGVARVSTLRRTGGGQMVVVTGLARADYLAAWRAERDKTVAGVTAFVLLSALSAWFVLHLLGRITRENARNRLYLHHASDGIHILDATGNVVEASERFCQMLGYPRAEVIGMNITQWDAQFPPEVLLREMLPAQLGKDVASTLETRHRRSDGEIIDVEVNVVGIDLDGRRYLHASSRDIGERKRQQRALQEREAQLRESEERYRLLLDNSPTGILHYDRELIVTYSNERFEQIMQVPKGHMRGLDCKRLQDQSVVPALREAADGRTARYEGPYVTSYGHVELWISMACAPVVSGGGEILGGIAIVEDITARRRSEEAEERQRASLVRLNEIAALSHLDLAAQLRQALATGAAHLGLEFGIVSRVEGEDYHVLAQVSPPDTLHDGQIFPLGTTYCQLTLQQDRVLAIAEMGHSPWHGHHCYRTFHQESYIGAPVHVGGKVFGTVNFSSPHAYRRGFDAGDEEFVRLLARWVGSAVERDRAQAGQRLAASVFTHAHEGIVICDAAQVILDVNPTFSEITGYTRDEVLGRTPRMLSSGRQDGAFYRDMWDAVRQHGHWEGEVWNRRKDGASYAERLTISRICDEHERPTHYIGTFSDITVLKEQRARLERLAHFDPLTQLPNRALLSDRMAQALPRARRCGALAAVCYLDLDGFKAVNDRHGHDAGDALLIEVARRLRSTVRAGDTVARLGGDEFVLILGVDDLAECDRAATRLLQALAEPIAVKGQACRISGSLGITLYPDDDSDPDTLLRHADQAMYLAKQTGKNRYQLFDAAQDHRARHRRDTLAQVERALANGEFRLYYQPIVDMRSGKVLGFEGLIRWQHPERGLLLPADFLPALEGTELDAAVGRWVLAEGIRQLGAWRAMGLPQNLNLNVSAGHLLTPGFADELVALLAAQPRIEPHSLELEVPEAAAVRDQEAAIAVFRRCHEAGVEISLDDFGAGHSSLACLRRLPVDTLKIDQGFMQTVLGDSEDLAVVDSVIGLTRAFKRRLVAEGVESAEIGMLLLSLGCDIGQGYGIARPMPAEAVPQWLAGFVPDRGWLSPATRIERDDMPLLLAELEHRAWVRRLGAWLDANPEAPSPPALDSRQCPFGQWYHGAGQRHFGQLPAFGQMDAIHEEVHRLAAELVRLRTAGEDTAARARFAELCAARDRLLEQVAAVQVERGTARAPASAAERD